MKRTKTFQKATAILTADMELRNTVPICRTDDFMKTQERKIAWLVDLQKKHECPILDGGDLFDKRMKQHPSHLFIAWAIANLPRPIYTIPGNHDLPGKSLANYANSAMNVMQQAGVVSGHEGIVIQPPEDHIVQILLHRYPWGVEIKPPPVFNEYSYNVALLHALVYDGTKPFPECEGWEKEDLLDVLEGFDLIVCGDHHATFTGKRGKTLLVNPGSLMRNDADQIDHKPCVFLWYAKEGRVVPEYVPIEQGVITREHIDEKIHSDNRLSAFVEKLGQQVMSGINFEKNLQNLLIKNVSQGIINKVWEYYEKERRA